MATERQAPRPHVRRAGHLELVLGTVTLMATAGCVGQGVLCTRVTTPYSREFRETPAGRKSCRVNERIYREPMSGANVSVRLTHRVLQEAARGSGITNLYYADLETVSVLFGVFEQKTLILYGD